MKIIYLEDDESLQSYFKTLFSEMAEIVGYRTIEETVQHLKINGPSIDGIITDDNVLDGGVVHNFDRIRSIYKGPVVLISGNDYELDEMQEIGFTHFYQKPVGMNEYTEAIKMIEGSI